MAQQTYAQKIAPAYNLYNQTLNMPPYATYRRVRKDPTIALVRTLINAAITSAPWSIGSLDGVPEDRVRFIQDEMAKHRDEIVERAAFAAVDYGNQGWELIWDTDDGVNLKIGRAKPLLQDITRLMVDQYGQLIYFVQDGPYGEIYISTAENMHMSWRVEGDQWYGEPLLINVLDVFDNWEAVDAAALRFDLKLAAGQMIIRYPKNEPFTIDGDGVSRPTAEIAKELGETLVAGGIAAIQSSATQNQLDTLQLQNPDWDISMLDTAASSPQYNERLEYMDKLKVRGLGFPERSVLEATSAGSRADSGTAYAFAVNNLTLIHSIITKNINKQLINKLLAFNYGEDTIDTIFMIPGPILDSHKESLFELTSDLIKSRPEVADLDTLMDRVDIPKSEEIVEVIPEVEQTPEPIVAEVPEEELE